MKRRNASNRAVLTAIPHHRAAHDPGLDDYDLPAHIDIDYSKAKPNRFAGQVNPPHGGKRNGSGRKRTREPIERHTITLYRSHAKRLRQLDPNLSKAIRKLIEASPV
jgi:hypothetical protein